MAAPNISHSQRFIALALPRASYILRLHFFTCLLAIASLTACTSTRTIHNMSSTAPNAYITYEGGPVTCPPTPHS